MLNTKTKYVVLTLKLKLKFISSDENVFVEV